MESIHEFGFGYLNFSIVDIGCWDLSFPFDFKANSKGISLNFSIVVINFGFTYYNLFFYPVWKPKQTEKPMKIKLFKKKLGTPNRN